MAEQPAERRVFVDEDGIEVNVPASMTDDEVRQRRAELREAFQRLFDEITPDTIEQLRAIDADVERTMGAEWAAISRLATDATEVELLERALGNGPSTFREFAARKMELARQRGLLPPESEPPTERLDH